MGCGWRLPADEDFRAKPIPRVFASSCESMNRLREEDIGKIVQTYQFRKEEERYSRRVGMTEIEKNDFNLNISRYISTAVEEEEIDLKATHADLVKIEKEIRTATAKHNAFPKELGLPPLP
jgi:type I restriction enzyme M protein